MKEKVEIDPHSGFCGGVIRAIDTAQSYLDSGEELYSLGSIVHNDAELGRLSAKGLVTLDRETFETYGNAEGKTLLIRAHGEPPRTYDIAREKRFKVVDCTCPVVLKLQESIAQAYRRLHENGKNGTVVIFGKRGHAEVLGLLGQVDGDAVVVENAAQLRSMIACGEIDLFGPVEIFSQTTKSPGEYAAICAIMEDSMARYHELPVERFRGTRRLTVHKTICSQVASRNAGLADFAVNHDVIIFVSGADSSNGKVLCDLCRSMNIRTYHINSPEDVRPEWLRYDDSVGVCGATSTPKWLLEEVAQKILQMI